MMNKPQHSDAPHTHHSHVTTANADKRYLWAGLVLAALFMVSEAIIGYFANALVLLSDAVDKLSDTGAIALAIAVSHISKFPARGRWTYGFRRAEVLSGLLNSITILVVAIVIIVKAIDRIIHPTDIIGIPVLATALAGMVVNLAITWLLSRADRSNLNIRGAYQHIITDLYASTATAIAGIIIITTGWRPADSLASLIVAFLMTRASWDILRDAIPALMEAPPAHISPDEIRDHLRECKHVEDVHDLHVWTIDSGTPLVSAHVTVSDCANTDHYHDILDTLQECLRTHFGITHSTFQCEPTHHTEHEEELHH